MNLENFNVAMLLELEKDSPRGCALQFSYCSSHDVREKSLRKLLDYLCNEFEKNRHVKTEDFSTEDSLTIDLVMMMKALKIDAAHDKQHGGHCDIVVEGNDNFLWLAEAKIHGGYSWLDKGFRQLSTRYSTGVAGQDTGEVLIYCWNTDSRKVLEKWRTELKLRQPDVTVDEKIDVNTLTFNSTHEHSSTGRPFRVRHKIVSLYFEPEDK